MTCIFCRKPLIDLEPVESNSNFGVCDLCAAEHLHPAKSETIEIESEEYWIDTPLEDRNAA